MKAAVFLAVASCFLAPSNGHPNPLEGDEDDKSSKVALTDKNRKYKKLKFSILI